MVHFINFKEDLKKEIMRIIFEVIFQKIISPWPDLLEIDKFSDLQFPIHNFFLFTFVKIAHSMKMHR